jgi:hypothetical protein
MRFMLKGSLILALMFSGSGTATCPYDGQTAYATGHTKTIHTIKGETMSCEYSHPINILIASGSSVRCRCGVHQQSLGRNHEL